MEILKATPKAPVITIVGFPGAGKTTLAGMFPSPIFIQAETASTVFETWDDDVQPSFFPELPAPKKDKNIKTSGVVRDQLLYLATQEHDFKTVIIDSVTSLNQLFEREVVEYDPMGANNIGDAAGGFHKGFMVSAGMHADIRRYCEVLRKKGITVIFLAHSGIVKMKNRPDAGEYTAFTIDMPEKSRNTYIAHSDAVIYIKSEEFVLGTETNKKGQVTKYGRVTNTGDRILITSSDGTVGYIDAKNRYDLPQQIKVEKGENPLISLIPFFNKAGV